MKYKKNCANALNGLIEAISGTEEDIGSVITSICGGKCGLIEETFLKEICTNGLVNAFRRRNNFLEDNYFQ